MTAPNLQYDVIFTTKVATVGLVFSDSTLMNIVYLEKRRTKETEDKIIKSVRNKLERILNLNSSCKKIESELKKIKIQLEVTPFQKSVLMQLQKIPYGETRTYGDIAKILKTSPRAVGNACRTNPLPIIIPCHRVVAANGIGGYDGATKGKTLEIKYQLLKQEGVNIG